MKLEILALIEEIYTESKISGPPPPLTYATLIG